MTNYYLITSLAPITSDIKEHMIEQMSTLHELKKLDKTSKLVWVSINKSTKDINAINKVWQRVGLNTDIFDDFIYLGGIIERITERKPGKTYTWQDFGEELKNSFVKELRERNINPAEVTNFFVYGGIIDAAFRKTTNKLNKTFLQKPARLNFVQSRVSMSRCLWIYPFCEEYNVPISQFHLDPEEIYLGMCDKYQNLNYKSYFKYNFEYSDGTKNLRSDALSYYHKLINETHLKLQKTKNFVFGATCFNLARASVIPLLEELYEKIFPINSYKINNLEILLPEKSQLFFKNSTNLETNIPTNFTRREEYLIEISLSRYTLIWPSYFSMHFSIERFVEAIARDCLPFIYNTANYSILEQFGLTKDYIENKLVVADTEELLHKLKTYSEEERIEILNLVKSKLLVYKFDMFNI